MANKKTTTDGKLPNGRNFTITTYWVEGKVSSESVDYHEYVNADGNKIGSVGIFKRQDITSAEFYHYLRTGDNGGKKIFAT